MSKKPSPIPPPPATGGSFTWDARKSAWVQTERTIQPYEPDHEANRPPAETAVETPLKDA